MAKLLFGAFCTASSALPAVQPHDVQEMNALRDAIFSDMPLPANDFQTAMLKAEEVDCTLQQKLKLSLLKNGFRNAVSKGTLNVALVDVSNPALPRLAMVNGHDMVYAASLPKIAILLGAFAEIEKGRLSLDEMRADMTAMIRHSSNAAATRVLEKVGRKNLIEILKSPRFGFYDENTNGGLWVGKPYGKEAAYKRDPLHGFSHGATAFQTARFYYQLQSGQLFSPALNAEMKDILSKPAIKHKFVKALGGKPDVKLYRKSGTWRDYHADSAIVEHGDKAYIIIGLARGASAGKSLVKLAKVADDLVLSDKSAAKSCALPIYKKY